MSVKNCPLGFEVAETLDCNPKDCNQCQNDDAQSNRRGPADELPNYDYYAQMPPY